MMKDIDMKEALKNYIIDIVKRNTSDERPYYFIRWTGLSELAKVYGYDILNLIDELITEKKLKKALIKGKLAIYLPNRNVTKIKRLKEDFENFLKQLQR